MTKHGACDMIYKPEHITDLDTGVIVAAEVRCGDEGDTVGLAGRVLARVCDDPGQTDVLTSLTADEGYFAVEEACCLQMERVRVIIGDPQESKRKPDKQDAVRPASAPQGQAGRGQQERQGVATKAWRAPRTELLPCA